QTFNCVFKDAAFLSFQGRQRQCSPVRIDKAVPAKRPAEMRLRGEHLPEAQVKTRFHQIIRMQQMHEFAPGAPNALGEIPGHAEISWLAKEADAPVTYVLYEALRVVSGGAIVD